MTLVAILFSDETPLIVTDMLVSQVKPDSPGVTSPLLESVDKRQGEHNWLPAGLALKYWIFPDGTFFFFAGWVDGAREVFDRVSQRLSDGDLLTRKMLQEERDSVCNGSLTFSCITISPENVEQRHDYVPVGEVKAEAIDGYGYVLAIGSGAGPFMELLRRHKHPDESDDPGVRVLAALNAATLATFDYLAAESSLAKASSGGYFEVTIPSFFKENWRHLMRGSSHLFVNVDERGLVLTQFAASKQNGSETVILSGHNLGASERDGCFLLCGDSLHVAQVATKRKESYFGRHRGESSIAHLSAISIYAHRNLPCGHAAHTRTVLYDYGSVVASLHEDDSAPPLPGQTPDLLLVVPKDKIKRVSDRLMSATCPRCGSGNAGGPE